jgi:hypothetical protein
MPVWIVHWLMYPLAQLLLLLPSRLDHLAADMLLHAQPAVLLLL